MFSPKHTFVQTCSSRCVRSVTLLCTHRSIFLPAAAEYVFSSACCTSACIKHPGTCYMALQGIHNPCIGIISLYKKKVCVCVVELVHDL